MPLLSRSSHRNPSQRPAFLPAGARPPWHSPLLALLCLLFLAAAPLFAAPAIPVILSTDVGNEIDDQWAIAYLLTQPDFDVRGLISAHAPSLPDPAAHASFLILRDEVEHRLGMQVHPPLLEGSSLPLADRTTPRVTPATSFLLAQAKDFTPGKRLTVIVIGAATDIASALLLDPTLADRIRIVAMAFHNLSPQGAHEYNEQNDPLAWQVLLHSRAPITVGTGDICERYLSLDYAHAQKLLEDHGPVAAWLWSDYRVRYFREIKPPRLPDFSKSAVIWDIITLAYLEGMTTSSPHPRPELDEQSNFVPGASSAIIETIDSVDSKRLWSDFTTRLDAFKQTHKMPEKSED